jgi:hypothetical protein
MPDFKFVAVLELQKRGALHAHLAIKGFRNVKILRHHWCAVVGVGNVDITAPRGGNHAWRPVVLAGYLSKYMGKDFSESDVLSVKRWTASQGIAKPIKTTFFLPRGDATYMLFDDLLRSVFPGAKFRLSSFHDPTLYGLFASPC